jgi:hypothetical protein
MAGSGVLPARPILGEPPRPVATGVARRNPGFHASDPVVPAELRHPVRRIRRGVALVGTLPRADGAGACPVVRRRMARRRARTARRRPRRARVAGCPCALAADRLPAARVRRPDRRADGRRPRRTSAPVRARLPLPVLGRRARVARCHGARAARRRARPRRHCPRDRRRRVPERGRGADPDARRADGAPRDRPADGRHAPRRQPRTAEPPRPALPARTREPRLPPGAPRTRSPARGAGCRDRRRRRTLRIAGRPARAGMPGAVRVAVVPQARGGRRPPPAPRRGARRGGRRRGVGRDPGADVRRPAPGRGPQPGARNVRRSGAAPARCSSRHR